jgi:hypothetical protein
MERDVQFIGQSGAFLDAVERASRAAPMRRPVLVIGERGTGKELIAERLHRLSARWQEPLVTMNCAALPETLIEAELFGHEAGAFTGATRARAGRFEEADKGTLFLDELGTLSMGAQERLLRAVEYGEVTRIGASRPIRVDVRIVAATNEDLPRMAAQGRFRADLLDRLSFEVITLPPLRVREGDVAVLADHFGRRMAAELQWDIWPGFAPTAPSSSKHTPGRATCANCATWSNARSTAGTIPTARSPTSSSTRSTARGNRRARPSPLLPYRPNPRTPHQLRHDRRLARRGRRPRTRDPRTPPRSPPLQPAPDRQGPGPDLRPAPPLPEKHGLLERTQG